MKKLLSLLGAVVLSATSASTLVACSSDIYQDGSRNENIDLISSAYDETKIEASLIARAKSLIVDNIFGFSDDVSKQYVLNNNAISDLTNVDANSKVGKETIVKPYGKFIDDSGLKTDPNFKDYFKKSVGNDGGIIEDLRDEGIDAVASKISASNKQYIKVAIESILDILGLNDSSKYSDIVKVISPILGIVQNVNTGVAMLGIPAGLDTLATVKLPGLAVTGIDQLVSLITGQLKKPIQDMMTSLNDDANITAYADHKMSQVPDDLTELFSKLFNGGKDGLKNGMQFISLLVNYLSFIDHTNNGKLIDNLANTKDKTISDSKYFVKTKYTKVNDGKQAEVDGTAFNMMPLLNDASYYLGEGTNQDKVLELAQALFLTSDGTNVSLNSLGKMLLNSKDGGWLLKMVNSLLDDNNQLTEAEGTDIFLSVLQNTTKIKYSSDLKEDDLNALFDNKDPFEVIYSDWGELKKLKNVDNLGDVIKGKSIIGDIFSNDNAKSKDEDNWIPSLQYLLNTLPLYKLLYASAQGGADLPGFSGPDLVKNGGLLPNYAGHYTQSSISQLASEAETVFNLNTSTTGSDTLAKQYFDFGKLSNLVNDLLFEDNDHKEMNGKSVLSTIINAINKKEITASYGALLGYKPVSATGDGKPGIDPNYVKEDSALGLLISTFMPSVKAKDGYYVYRDINEAKREDTLGIFMSGLAQFVRGISKATDYDYWEYKVLKNNGDNKEPGNSPWYYKDSKSGYEDIFGSYGFTKETFKNSNSLKKITLVIRFDISQYSSIINHLKINNGEGSPLKEPIAFKFTISRNRRSDRFTFEKPDQMYLDN